MNKKETEDAIQGLRVPFRGPNGSELVGRLHPSEGTPRGVAIFAHCFTCGKDVRAAREVSRALAERSISTLRFDFTGLGESPGDFGATNFSTNVADIIAAFDHLKETLQAPSILIGHSLGGAAVLSAAAELGKRGERSVRAVVTIGAPADPEHVRHLIDAQAPDLEDKGVCTVTLGGRPFRMQKQFLEDLRSQEHAKSISELGAALLVMHSPQDEIVGIDNARMIYQAARHPKSYVSLDGANHLLTKRADSRYVADLICAWVPRYLPEKVSAEPPTPSSPVAEGAVRVSGITGLKQQVETHTHSLVADEPVSLGGTNEGPAPYEFLLASLGACTSMTLRLYADRKKWPLEAAVVELSHRKAEEKGGQDRIERSVSLTGDLDAEQRKRLGEIADRCPVHRTLTRGLAVHTTVAEPGPR